LHIEICKPKLANRNLLTETCKPKLANQSLLIVACQPKLNKKFKFIKNKKKHKIIKKNKKKYIFAIKNNKNMAHNKVYAIWRIQCQKDPFCPMIFSNYSIFIAQSRHIAYTHTLQEILKDDFVNLEKLLPKIA
jgi:hypothetical protein